MQATERFQTEVISQMREDIVDAGGNEVLWIGKISQEKIVISATVAARGHLTAVSALFPHMEEGDLVIHNHPSGVLTPSNPDLRIASQLGNNGIGFYIVDNRVEEVYAVCEPVQVHSLSELEEDTVAAYLEPGGLLAMSIPDYEPRASQIGLLKSVTRAFNQNHILVAEAGTGVGKSFAYLIPSILWALSNKERIVISTGTINLQQQLVEKDIPAVQKILEQKVKAVLVKGRGNYLCPVRFAEELAESSSEDKEYHQLEKIKEWSEQTSTGSLSDLTFLPDSDIWGRICSEADTCTGLKCFQRDQCFVTRARKEASSASILVVNHHLLFSDLNLRLQGAGYDQSAVLPSFQRLVLDEAHGIERAATSYFSSRFTAAGLSQIIRRLYRNRRGRTLGLFPHYEGFATQNIDLAKVPALIAATNHGLEKLRERGLDLLGSESGMRFTAESQNNPLIEPFFLELSHLRKTLLEIHRLAESLHNNLEEEELELPSAYELGSVKMRLEGIIGLLGEFPQFHEREEEVFFMERYRSQGKTQIILNISPLDITEKMRKGVYEPLNSVVMVSATLSIGGNFRYFGARVGLSSMEKEDVIGRIYPSPFDYPKRVLLAIPQDSPQPTAENYQHFLNKGISSAIKSSGGGALVLFTSYESMKRTHESISPLLSELGILSLRQGEDDRTRLLNQFKENHDSVLFATDSFWEGVDSPGQTLRLVILAKLPFRVPSEPMVQARMELLEKRGMNPFYSYSLPEAVIRLKQGFGRLMRRNDDSGVVLIMDSRIVTKRYGREFIDSLPPARVVSANEGDISQEINDFFSRNL